MLEIVGGIAVAVMLWSVRKAFFAKTEVFQAQVDLSVKKSEVELQDDYAEIVQLVQDKKTEQNGQWFTMSDIDKLMKTTTPATDK